MSEVKHHGARRIWIAWETQRRSITLSSKVGAELHILDLSHHGVWRYPLCLLRTARLLFANRGGVVFVQNPSMILAAFAAFCKPILRYTLVVDRHTNFTQIQETRQAMVRHLLLWMSRFSIRRADLTIVTNADIDERYVRGTGRGFVLPDPYPELPTIAEPLAPASSDLKVLFVSSWQTDEPIREVIEVCRRLGSRITVYISGRVKPAYASLLASRPENFIPTGFLTDDEYFRLMSTVDCVLAVSNWPGTLCCGAYEGVAMGKPVILNDERITKGYFSAGALYTDSSVADLEQQFRFAAEHRAELTAEVRLFFRTSAIAWGEMLDDLNRTIHSLRS